MHPGKGPQASPLIRTLGLPLLLLLGLTGLTGCTFTARLPDGRVVQASLPDWEVRRVVERLDALSLELLQESRRARAYGLARVATELRAELARLLRQMGAGQVVDLQKPALKLKAYEWQLQGLMTFSERPERYAPLKRTLERLKRVFWGFVERLLQADP